MTTSLTVAKHRANLEQLRADTLAGIDALRAAYDELDPEEAASDVGAGEDEGGSEGDLTRFERDRIRGRIAEDNAQIEIIDKALARTHDKTWKNCSRCGNPIGEARLEALPATDLCVTCKADRASW